MKMKIVKQKLKQLLKEKLKINLVIEHYLYLKKNGLRKIRFHDLRHSCATLLLKKGISLREIQDWLGHSSSKTTEKYAHLDSSTKIKSASAIENALSFNGNKKDILDLDSNTSN